MAWALVADALPLYPLYALLFADTGLSDAQISLLFAIWSVSGLLAEVPSGALADRFSRRWALVIAGGSQAACMALWTAVPGFVAFAAGFVLWGAGGSFVSGAQEALLYDGLSVAGARDKFARVQGWVSAAELVAQIPSAVAATVLFPLGSAWSRAQAGSQQAEAAGYELVGWASVGVCLLAAALAARLPDARPGARTSAPGGAPDGAPAGESTDGVGALLAEVELGYLATLRAGVREAVAHPAIRAAVLALAVVTGLDALEEYFGLMARDWGVGIAAIPAAMLGITLAGAAGAFLGGTANRLPTNVLVLVYATALVLLLVAGLVARPVGLAGVAVCYGLYRAVLVVCETRLQDRIESGSRATVTSVAGLAIEIVGIGLFGVWAAAQLLEVSGTVAVALVWLAGTLVLPRWLRRSSTSASAQTGTRPSG